MNLAMTVTKAIVKEYPGYGYYNQMPKPHLCLTGSDENGRRFWVKLPEGRGMRNGRQFVFPGDVVQLDAKVKGMSDDGRMTFLNYAKLGAVIDAETVEAAEDPEQAAYDAEQEAA